MADTEGDGVVHMNTTKLGGDNGGKLVADTDGDGVVHI